MTKRTYVWELPVRVTHWLNVLAIAALTITGIYIGNPYIHALKEEQLIMALMRFFHFLAAYLFLIAFLVRIYWLFAGNKYARLDQFIPASEGRMKNLVDTMAFYLFLRKDLPHSTGHTAIAGFTYFFMFLIFIVSILTGFALYAESHVGGFWTLMGGWLLGLFSTGTIRLVHHCSMWVILIFIIPHVYISIHNALIEKNGLITSIINGYKVSE